MSWTNFLYCYAQERGGLFLGGEDDDGALILVEKDRPLMVNQSYESSGRNGWYTVRARTAIQLEREYTLKIGAWKGLSGGVNTLLGTLDRGLEKIPNTSGLLADYGCPEVTRKRLIRTSDRRFTRQVLQSLELRNALLASPWDALTVQPGPGGAGFHQVEIVAGNEGWESPNGEVRLSTNWEEIRADAHERFFPRMDQLLELVRAARDAVTVWRM